MNTKTVRRAWMAGMASFLLAVAVYGGEATAQLRVTTAPPGAMVVCDGILREAAPVTIDGLTPGPHLVTVEMAGYVAERKTVVLAAGEKSALEINLESEKGLVLVHSEPDGADIIVDGAHRGKTPLLLTDLSRGTYRFRASSPGYQDREMEVKVEGRVPRKLMMTLNSDSARLAIHSRPEGASVMVNGLSRGVTPCVLERLPAGESKIVLTLADYTAYQSTVILKAGDDHRLEAELIPMPASLSVVGAPVGAKVYVDDQMRGAVPLTIGTIAPGRYTLKVEMAGYESETREVDLKNRDTRAEEFNLVRNVGMMEAGTDQPGTLLLVDGEEKGTIPVMMADKAVEPLKVELAVGDHQVEFRKKGYFPVTKTVSIVKGGNVSIRESMRRNFVADTVVKLKGNEDIDGVLSRKFPNGDLEIETRPGIFKTVKAGDILSVELAPVSP